MVGPQVTVVISCQAWRDHRVNERGTIWGIINVFLAVFVFSFIITC